MASTAGGELIEAAGAEAGRVVEPDHYGINLAVSERGLPDGVLADIRMRRPDVDPTELITDGWPKLDRIRQLLGRRAHHS